ncbi:RCC1 domain-containing protein [Xylanibacillus composti]|uniref:RCC1 domain-containing protein n=1 Tax=Xylanibacillus composti TaxID=1572762 RepID=UPI0028F70E78|nr:InlB B-repeat-containing protein [Xylanibacillus composti]
MRSRYKRIFRRFVQTMSLLALVTGAVMPFHADPAHGAKADSGRRAEMAAIAAGYGHSLALKTDGSVVAWGANDYSQTAVPAEAESGVVAIAAGEDHSLALKTDGTVVAWGYFGATDVPDGLSGVVSITAGGNHSLALKADGSVVAWGSNHEGQTTVPAEAESGVAAIAAGNYHSLALKADGSVVAWGSNHEGQTTVPMEAESDVVAIAAGYGHSLALKADGSVVAWGSNVYDQTTVPAEAESGVVAIAAGSHHSLALKADGTVVAWGYNAYDVPEVPTGAQSDVVEIASGNYHALALKADGTVVAWGWNDDGQTIVPADIVIPAKTKRIAAGSYHSLALKADGTVVAWGLDDDGQTTVPAEAQSDVVAIAAGTRHSLVLKSDGTVVAWGGNGLNQTAVPAGAQTGVVAITAGSAHSLALKADGAVVAWGYNAYDQTVVPAGAQTGVVAIAAGSSHSLALKSDGTVVAWGSPYEDQTVVPDGLSDVVAIAAGGDHSLALKSDGSVVSWGSGTQTTVPAEAKIGVVAIAAGSFHSLALKADGSVVAWGSNNDGQTTVPAEAQTDVVAIAAGHGHSLALKADGTVVAWGRDNDGQISVPYTVTFDKNGGDAEASPMTMTVAHGGNVGTLPTPPTREGYTFTGWNTAKGGDGAAFEATTAVTADITVYAQWTAIPTYTVTFDKNGGETEASPMTMTVAHGGNVGTLPTPPTRAGYTFAGWNTAEGGNGAAFEATTEVTTDLTVYAQWTANPIYTVTFDKNGGDTDANPTVTTVVYGGNVGTLPTPPTRAGYTFTGWNTQAEGQGDPFDAATAVFADITVYAQWTAIPTYTVTYHGNGHTGGSVPSDNHRYLQGAVVTVQGNPGSLTRSGYTFAGWNTQEDGTGTGYAEGSIFTMGTEDVALYAQWTANNRGSRGSGGGAPSPSCDAKATSTDGTLTLPACRAGEVSLGDAVTVIIPEGASDKELTLTIEEVLDGQRLLTDRDVLVSPIYEIVKNVSDGFNQPVTLILAFDPAKLKANQAPVVRYYDEAKQEWVEIAGGEIEGNRIAVEVDRFAKFAVFAADQAAAEPVEEPAKPEMAFSDISGHWAEASIKKAVVDGIVAGYPDGTFKPNHPVTRAEFIVMLAGAMKLDGAGAALHFQDQDQIGSWAKGAAALAVEAGIVSGYEDGSFRPDAKITRAEMASMIAQALKARVDANGQTGFADDEDIPNWAKGAVEAIRKLGIVSGRGGNQFAPNDTATRAEAVVMLLGMLERN